MTLNKHKLLEAAQRQLVLRNEALSNTLQEIELLENIPGTEPALLAARAKRDRQHNTAQATQILIDALTTSIATDKAKAKK